MDENKDNKKTMWTIIISIAVIIAIILAIIFMMNRNSEDENEDGTTSVPTIDNSDDPSATGGNSPSSGDADEDNAETSPTDSINPDEPVAPTTGRPGEMHEGHDHASGDPNDPAYGPPDFLAKNAIRQVFTIELTDNASWDRNFQKIVNQGLVTENMKNNGFVKWYGGTGHTSGWEANRGNKVMSFVNIGNRQLVSNDTYRVSLDVRQRMMTKKPKGYSNMPSFEVSAIMKYEDDKWLLDSYSFPGDYPNIH